MDSKFTNFNFHKFNEMDAINQLKNKVNQLGRDGKFKEIDTLLSDELLQHYNSADLYLNKAISQRELKRIDNMLSYLNAAIDADPNHTGTLLDRGLYYHMKGEVEKAMADYSKGIELKPDFAELYVNRGALLATTKKFKEALHDFNTAITYKNKLHFGYSGRANVLKELNQAEAALIDYAKAIELAPSAFDGYVNRSKLFQMLNRNNEALSDIDKAISLENRIPYLFRIRAELHLQLRNDDEALMDFQKSIELGWPGPECFIGRGLAWYNKRRYWNAVDDFTTALELNKDLAQVILYRGNTYFDAHEFEKAIIDLEAYQKISGTNAVLEDRIRLAKENLASSQDTTLKVQKVTSGKKAVQGRRPAIPAALERQVRQKCKFACVICGNPVCDYEHIEEYASVQKHELENLTLLCTMHHREKTAGRLSKEVIRERSRLLEPRPVLGADLNFKRCRLNLGTVIIYSIPGVLFSVHEKDFFSVGWDPIIRQVIFNAVFYDQKGHIIFKIVDNIYSTSNDVWDVQLVGKELIIHQGPGDILLRVNIDGELNEITVIGKLFYQGDRYVHIRKDGIYCNNNLKCQECTIEFCDTGLLIAQNKVIPPGAGIRLVSKGSIEHNYIGGRKIGLALAIEGLNQEYDIEIR